MPHTEGESVGREFNNENMALEQKAYDLLRPAQTAQEIRAAFIELDGGEPSHAVTGEPFDDKRLFGSRDARLKRARDFLVRHGIELK